MVARKLIAWVLIPVPVVLVAIYRPDRAIRVGDRRRRRHRLREDFRLRARSPGRIRGDHGTPGIRRLRWGLRLQLDRDAGIVDASVMGLFASRAAFHDGLGCVLLHGSKAPYLLKSDIDALKVPKSRRCCRTSPAPPSVEPSDPALKAALDHAFEEPPSRRSGGPRRWSWCTTAR